MKQFLLICDENAKAVLDRLFAKESIQFLEVQGMGMGPGQNFNVLVTPIIPPVPPMPPIQPPPQPSPGTQPEVPEEPKAE